MGLRTCDETEEPEPLRNDVVYSLSKCEGHKLSVTYVPLFSTLLEEWQVVFAKYLALRDKIARAESRLDGCDDELDILVGDVASALILIYKDRNTAEFREYFGSKQPYEVKDLLLGEELDIVRGWITPLKASLNSLLQALGVRAEELVKNADAVVAAHATAVQELRTFRLTGDYSLFVAHLNRVRKTVYGELSKLPHQPEGKGLPDSFAERFFRHEKRRNKKQTIESVKKQIKANEVELAKLKVALAELEEKEKQRQAEIVKRAALEAELEETEKARREAEEREEELRRQLKK